MVTFPGKIEVDSGQSFCTKYAQLRTRRPLTHIQIVLHICCCGRISTKTQTYTLRVMVCVYPFISCSVNHQANEQFKYSASVTVPTATEESVNI